MPITVAPVRAASCTANTPTPPAAPATTTVSPSDSETARTAAQAVTPATCSEPATSHGTDGGRGVNCVGGDGDQLRLAVAVVAVADHLVADRDRGHVDADRLDDAREIGPLDPTGTSPGRGSATPLRGSWPRPG